MKKYWPGFVVVVLLSILLLPQPVAACSCIPHTPAQGLERAAAVFRGHALPPSWWTFPPGAVRFQVNTRWKGSVGSVVDIDPVTGSCHYPFAPGVEYVVYAYVVRADYPPPWRHLETYVCSRTAPVNKATEDLSVLGPGTPVAWWEPSLELLWTTTLAAAIGGIGVVGLRFLIWKLRA
ncbi:MAG: hypothetical protein HY331_09080 [Chloroflexi bacterium]|nr:hypothetical protein [Chloroflexota bacterium]